MTDSSLSESQIFNEAIRLPAGQRKAYLHQACRGNAELCNELDALLAAHQQDGSFMNGPAVTCALSPAIVEGPGTMVGHYKLLQQIGEGGMGVVFMAEQEQPVRRRVALKIIKPGMDSRQVVARFEAERQALAMMDHQNIARVLDAGSTASGRPFFVMELVHGVPIIAFCEQNRLTLRQRLELFVPVCQAIQHAHQKGIIHRDIKPPNVLVTMYDDQPVPKVIDFGVAKAIEQRLTEKTLFTQYGTLVGTFEYMSPEQAEMNAFGVDTRSDIYSLGVLLYELLTGTTPLERSTLREAALIELVRLIREEEPPKPSVRLSTSSGLKTFADTCGTEPLQLSRLLQGELDWIVMKCLEKDRTRRYETANGLARDVQRYLRCEAVEACPPTTAYRLQKFGQKHRRLLATAAAFAVLLIIATTLSIALAVWALSAQDQLRKTLTRENQAKREAIEARQAANQSVERLQAATRITNEGIELQRRRNWLAAANRFTKAIETEPNLLTPYIERGNLYLSLGLWELAADDFNGRFGLASQAVSQTCFEHALLQNYCGNQQAYQQACAVLIEQHSASEDFRDRQAVIRARLLDAALISDVSLLAQQAEDLAQIAKTPWLLGLAGRARWKSGNPQRAEQLCREAMQLARRAPSDLGRVLYPDLAVALHQQKRTTEAKETLVLAATARAEWIAILSELPLGEVPELPGISWSMWLEFNISFREAWRIIEGSVPPADDRFDALQHRGLAALTYGELFSTFDTGRELAKQEQWDSAATEFVNVLDQLPISFRANSEEMRCCIEMVREEELYNRLVNRRPGDYRLHYARGHYLASKRLWLPAQEVMLQALTLLDTAPSQEAGPLRGRAELVQELAAIQLLTDNQRGFGELCKSIVELHAGTDDAIASSLLARALTLTPDTAVDTSQVVALAEKALARNGYAWNYYARGIALHRAGKNDQAYQSLTSSLEIGPRWYGRAQPCLALVLVCRQLQRPQEAQSWLDQANIAQQQLDRLIASSKYGYADSNFMSDWLSSLVLFAEVDRQDGSH